MNSQDLLGTASSAAIRQYLRAAQDYGIEPVQALDAVNMPHGIMDNSISRTHGRAFQSLIRWLIEQTRDPLFGLKSSRYVQPGSYSLVGYMAMNCRTAREALHITNTKPSLATWVLPKSKNTAHTWRCAGSANTTTPLYAHT